MLIAILAERLRKHNMKLAGIWAVGISIVAGAAIGVYMYQKKQEERKDKEAGEAEESESYDDIGSDVVITVDDDTPVVIVNDDSEITVLD